MVTRLLITVGIVMGLSVAFAGWLIDWFTRPRNSTKSKP